ncbi:hypothetical protein [Streptomyces sp. NBC_00648]|uniref:hypothetical protein n=1 Tax=Streptomyces sp. NBC_00648 TaxID=2975797 RepID=UPI00324EB4EE
MMGHTARRALRHGGCAALLTAALLMGTTACGAPDRRRPVTLEEAQRLALARLSVYESGPASVLLRVPAADTDVGVEAVVDYAAHRALGSYHALGRDGRVAWDAAGVSVAPGGGRLERPGAASRWSRRSYTRDPVDRALRLVLALGSDRPENAQLLAQSGPQWLGEKRLRGHTYTLFAGPRPTTRTAGGAKPSGPPTSPVTYWIDETGVLGRVEAVLTSGGDPVTVDFTGRRSPLPPGPWPSPVASTRA